MGVNSLRLQAEVPPALTAQRGGMDPVDGQLLANLPDLGVKEEGRVNDGLLGRNPHLGVIHLRIHGLGCIHLLETPHTHAHSYITWHVRACKNVQARHKVLSCICTLFPWAVQPHRFIYHLSVRREGGNFLTPTAPTRSSPSPSPCSRASGMLFLLYIIEIHRQWWFDF